MPSLIAPKAFFRDCTPLHSILLPCSAEYSICDGLRHELIVIWPFQAFGNRLAQRKDTEARIERKLVARIPRRLDDDVHQRAVAEEIRARTKRCMKRAPIPRSVL